MVCQRSRGAATFPTRRSSDRGRGRRSGGWGSARGRRGGGRRGLRERRRSDGSRGAGRSAPRGDRGHPRSEEHTSELQSRENLVCRLLLDTKKVYSERMKTLLN